MTGHSVPYLTTLVLFGVVLTEAASLGLQPLSLFHLPEARGKS